MLEAGEGKPLNHQMGQRSAEDLKVGIVGYGYASRVFHAPLIAAVPGLRLAAFSSSDPGKVEAHWPGVSLEPSAEALMARPDLDLIVIPTPNASHYPLARQALEAGKHVVVDKPFTLTLAEARSLEACAKQAGRLLSVFHNRRWDSDFLTLQSLLASGELGAIHHFESHFDRPNPQVRVRWRESAEPGAGLWYDLGPHLLDQALCLFGPPEALSLDLACQREGALIDDYFHAQLKYGQTRVLLHASTLVPLVGPRFTVHGSRGSYLKYGLDTQEASLKAGQRPPAPGWGFDPQPGSLSTLVEGGLETRVVPAIPGDYAAYYAGIRDALRLGAPNPVPASAAIQVMALIELGLLSAGERRECLVSP